MCVWWCKNPKHGMKDTMQNVLMGPKSRQPKTEWRRVGHRVYNKKITKKIIKIQIWRFIVLLDFSFHEIMVSQRQSDACQFCRCCRSHLTWVKTCGKWSFIEMLPHLKGYASILPFCPRLISMPRALLRDGYRNFSIEKAPVCQDFLRLTLHL